MSQEITVTLDGVQYPVVVDGDTIIVNGRLFAVEITDEGMVLVDGIAYDVTLEGETATIEGDQFPVQVEGLSLTAPISSDVSSAPAASAAEADTGAVLAIMPGKIVRVLVEPGQEIQEGDAVCVLEAMKMENELNARQGGTVQAVHVKPGDDVEKDQVLVQIE